MIEFGRETCGDLDAALRREWLETNGIGGFASSTVVGLNTRRYHGLLTAATRPPGGRVLLLAKLEETVVVDGRRHELGANQYPGAIHPQGHRDLASFRLDPFPVFVYEVEGLTIEKSVFMVHGENTTVVRYELLRREPRPGAGAQTAGSVLLELRPLIAFRDYHATTHRNDALDPTVREEGSMASVAPYRGLPELHVAHDAARLQRTGAWYHRFEYREETARGLDDVEDLFNPFVLTVDLAARRRTAVVASTERRDAGQAERLRLAEVERRRAVLAAAGAESESELVRTLVAAADAYLVGRDEGRTVIAGYPWFLDWGRDTMIALPGLTLSTGRLDAARGILLAFARYVDRGMIPNRFPDAGETPEYNTVDGTLWFFEAVRALVDASADEDFVRTRLYGTLIDIVDWHVRGTRFGIRVDGDGLLSAGEEGVQLTWMDAKVGDWVVTPRHGKPVEVQALWYNALRIVEDLARRFGDRERQERFGAMAERARGSFNVAFWNEAAGCLYDVVNGAERDGSIRPNQILAVGLPHGMLSRDRARAVVRVVERELLTPFGLRSLAPGDARYRGRYEGDVWSRDGSYHQGPVWPWLMGPFLRAYLRVEGDTAASRERASLWLDGLREHLRDAGLGQISEIFDGDAPHTPRGCPAQAWSVAEILRVVREELGPVRRREAPRREPAAGAVRPRTRAAAASRVAATGPRNRPGA